MPDGVVSIGYYAFRDCSRLAGITIPDSVTRIIGNQTFANCSSLTNVAIGNGLTRFDSYAFSSCTNLPRVTIGNGVTRTNAGAFQNCPSLMEVSFRGNAPSLNGSDVFKSDDKATVYYLSGTTGWGETLAAARLPCGNRMRQTRPNHRREATEYNASAVPLDRRQEIGERHAHNRTLRRTHSSSSSNPV